MRANVNFAQIKLGYVLGLSENGLDPIGDRYRKLCLKKVDLEKNGTLSFRKYISIN
jgi:hypothetical protein